VRREKLEEVLASVADSIAAEEEEEGMTTDGLQEIRKVLLPLGCITNAVKALVDEYSERLGTPEQRKRLKYLPPLPYRTRTTAHARAHAHARDRTQHTLTLACAGMRR
jgi:hypothetical protein